ncbi:MAG: MBL fold metallo-hydrolase [Gemmatimonadota bacterium]|nr:MBL fold metallo-hydrolase [Gemmatimonadota bacterium]
MSISRRRFVADAAGCASGLAAAAGCASYLATVGRFLPREALERWGVGGAGATSGAGGRRNSRGGSGRHVGRIVAQEPWARIEEVGPGMYAVISTPLGGDYTTVCNGGIIGGSAETLVVEAFMSERGAAWVAGKARELTGRWPGQVVVSHHHADHSAGAAGFAGTGGGDAAPALHATQTTRNLVVTSPTNEGPLAPWADAVLVPEGGPVNFDLGDRSVTVQPREGHTASDLTVEVDGGEGPVWCGDLVWNAMFPNYVDATPSRLSRSVRALGGLPAPVFVPGHGPLADAEALARYTAVIDSVEEAARDAMEDGRTAQEAAEDYEVPEELGEWTLFNPAYYQRAIEAWMRELGGGH